MKSFHEYMEQYRQEMQKGDIREAYRGLMIYIMGLRTYFANRYPDDSVSGNVYYGYMDMTYFSFVPKALKPLKLKVAIVFLHETCHFEVWLAGVNKQVQAKYWELFKEKNLSQYHMPETIKGADSIIESVIIETPDFSNLDKLTKQIDTGVQKFVKDMEEFLSALSAE